MNSIKNVPARVLNRRPGHSLEAEREQFDKTQASGGAAGGRVGLGCFTGLFYKRGRKKKIKVSGGGDADFFVNFFFGFFKRFF